MENALDYDLALAEINAAIGLAKCQQCGCLSDTLAQIKNSLPSISAEGARPYREALPAWVEKMKPIQYACLGCPTCYAGTAQNAFTRALPETQDRFGLSCEIKVNAAAWPPVVGEYFVLDPSAPVAVTTLASPDYPKQLADLKIPGIAIVGKLETENIGIDKLIKNAIANPNLRYLIVAGAESTGHFCGQTLLALSENGVDENGRVIGSKGKRPILRNVTRDEIESFRCQIKLIDLLGCECIDCVRDKVAELNSTVIQLAPVTNSCGCSDEGCHTPAEQVEVASPVLIKETIQPVKLDKAGYFVIIPIDGRKVIHVEHYSYENNLLHEIEGASARSLYLEIISQNWVSELSHAAYLGKELAKAELSLSYGIPYIQDAA